MKKIFATGFAVVAMLGTSIAFGGESMVVGESLDSGLGSLATTYSASEYVRKSDGSIEWPFAI